MIHQLILLIQQHPTSLTLASLWIYSALVTTMPQPLPNERWYGWIFNFLQAIAANLDKIGKNYAGKVSSTTNSDGYRRTSTEEVVQTKQGAAKNEPPTTT